MRLKELRKLNNVKPEELAKLLSISLQAYYKYENGTNEPNLDNLCKLADFYNISLDYLVGRERSEDIGFLNSKEFTAVSLIKQLNDENLTQEIGRLEVIVEKQ